MASTQISPSAWARLAGISGILGVLSYFTAAFVPFPDMVSRLLAFAFGPLIIVSFIGLYRFLADYKNRIGLEVGLVFGIIAGAMLTAMLVVQIGNNMVRADLLAAAGSEAAKESIKLSWGAVNRVQYLLDVVWDIFITISIILFGYALIHHPRFGKIWGISGILISFALLVLNLQSFPTPPAEAGSVDLGPLTALWMLGLYARLAFMRQKAPAPVNPANSPSIQQLET